MTTSPTLTIPEDPADRRSLARLAGELLLTALRRATQRDGRQPMDSEADEAGVEVAT